MHHNSQKTQKLCRISVTRRENLRISSFVWFQIWKIQLIQYFKPRKIVTRLENTSQQQKNAKISSYHNYMSWKLQKLQCFGLQNMTNPDFNQAKFVITKKNFKNVKKICKRLLLHRRIHLTHSILVAWKFTTPFFWSFKNVLIKLKNIHKSFSWCCY